MTAKPSPARRWSSVLLRAAHLVAVIGLSAGVWGTPAIHDPRWTSAVVASGLALFAIDYWGRPDRLREVSAASLLAKLALVALIIVLPEWQLVLFWSVVIWSVIFAHAPASFRHARIGGANPNR